MHVPNLVKMEQNNIVEKERSFADEGNCFIDISAPVKAIHFSARL